MTTHSGSCHCGQVAFEVEGEITGGVACNCSMCQRKGSLLWFVPRTALRVTTGEDAMATYTFNKHVIKHHFCPTCGCAPFGFGTGPSGDPTAAVNVRCLEGIALAELKRIPFDGRST